MKSSGVVLILMFLIGVSTIFAQSADSKGDSCHAEQNRQFDFWIGEWSIKQKILKADGKWFEADAETKVTPAIDGCALVENWSGEVLFFWEGMKTPEKIKGLSIRSFNPKTQKWVINWMDTRNPQFNSFEGNFANGKGEFFRTIKPAEGKETVARITFSDVTKTSVFWELAISSDDKKNWQTLWIMEMKRKPVEFIYHQRLIFLKTSVNGQGDLLFLFDTGASKSAIDLSTAGRINLPISGVSKVEGSAGMIEVKNARIKSLSVGDAKVFDLQVTAYDLSGVLAPPGMRVDGIIGYDFLRYFSIEIDYTKQTLTFSKNSELASKTQVSIPFTLDNNIPRIKGILDRRIEADFRLDTGASLFETTDIYLNTTGSLWNELTKLNPKLKPEKYFTGSGVGGTIKLPVARIKDVSFGEIKSENVFIIVQPKVGYFARSDAVGFVSNNLLEKYNPVTIDYLQKRIFLTKKD